MGGDVGGLGGHRGREPQTSGGEGVAATGGEGDPRGRTEGGVLHEGGEKGKGGGRRQRR